ncbi:MAG: HEAT repeat domain-containing protein [Armatimonadota bacterium]
MELSPSAQSAQHQDPLTGLITLDGWLAQLGDGIVPAAGSLLACDVVSLRHINALFGATAGETFLCVVVDRIRQALPDKAVVIRGPESVLLAWLPSDRGLVAQAFASHVRQTVRGRPVELTGGEEVVPKVTTATIDLAAKTPATAALDALRQELQQRHPETSAVSRDSDAIAASREELQQRLKMPHLLGRDYLFEELLAKLDLPALQPKVVCVVGPAKAGKSRLLSDLAALLRSQSLPLVEVTCSDGPRPVSCGVLKELATGFLTKAPDPLPDDISKLAREHPWLGALFPALHTGITPTPPVPDGDFPLRRVLESLLRALARVSPHIAMIHHLQHADASSLATLASFMLDRRHGMRLVASIDTVDEVIPPDMLALVEQSGITLTLPPLTLDQLVLFLEDVVPDLAQPAIAVSLHRATGGLPIVVEQTLRGWVDDGLLRYLDGHWTFIAEKLAPELEATLSTRDRQRLGQALLANSVSLELLAALWQTDEREVRAIIERGRALAFFHQENPDAPGIVQFTLSKEVLELVDALEPGVRTATRKIVDRLLASLPARGSAAAPVAGHPAPAEAVTHSLGWTMPAPHPVNDEDVDPLCNVIIALRLAGTQFRLYGPASKSVRDAVTGAAKLLNDLLKTRESLTITSDGGLVRIDGKILQRRDTRLALNDFQLWMSDANLRGIGILRGVEADELNRFFHLLVLNAAEEGATFDSKVIALGLKSIQVLSRYTQSTPAAAAPAEEVAVQLDDEMLARLADPGALTNAQWDALRKEFALATEPTRQAVTTHLLKWVRGLDSPEAIGNPAGFDRFLVGCLQQQNEPTILSNAARIASARLQLLLAEHEWGGMLSLLNPLIQRQQQDQSSETQALLSALLSRIGETTALKGLVDRLEVGPEADDEARGVVTLLGEWALRPLIGALKEAPTMLERVRLMKLLREFGDIERQLLARELAQENPWYVYRNILQVMSEVGTPEYLEQIVAKMHYPDARVRVEAVTAAVRIGRSSAQAYLLQGLADEHPEVRARTASLAGLCPRQEVLALLLQMLGAPRADAEKSDTLPVAICLALGHFPQFSEAYAMLLRVAAPGQSVPKLRKTDEVRAAAIMALGNYLHLPEARALVTDAMNDRSQQVRLVAQGVLRQAGI